jgi:hypothetical protein
MMAGQCSDDDAVRLGWGGGCVGCGVLCVCGVWRVVCGGCCGCGWGGVVGRVDVGCGVWWVFWGAGGGLTLALEHSKVCTLCDFGHLQFLSFTITSI